jgi:hypothetical protein
MTSVVASQNAGNMHAKNRKGGVALHRITRENRDSKSERHPDPDSILKCGRPNRELWTLIDVRSQCGSERVGCDFSE